jgi:hypothetical protein
MMGGSLPTFMKMRLAFLNFAGIFPFFRLLDGILLQVPLVLKWFLWLENVGISYAFLCFIDSPLCVMLRELVEIDSFNRTEHGPTAGSVSVLSGIFRAIQKAEDPADSEITPVCILTTVRCVLFALPFCHQTLMS